MGFPNSDYLNDGGIAVNVNGDYGTLTRDPSTGRVIVDVNTTGRPVYGQPVGGTGSVASTVFGNLPGWMPLAIVIAVFALALGAVGSRK